MDGPAVQTHTDTSTVIQDRVVEIRELLIDLLQLQGNQRAGAKLAPLAFTDDVRISMTEAATRVRSKSIAKNRDSLECHVQILEQWATRGFNGIVLETEIVRDKCVTSREAVARFKEAAFCHPEH